MDAERTADAYARALSAARAALAVGPEAAARSAAATLAEVDDPDDLRRVAGALAFLAVHGVPASVRRHRSVGAALDRAQAEVLWLLS